jgi:hypothetical protein
VSVESLPGQGTTFVVDIPVDATVPAEESSDAVPPAPLDDAAVRSVPERMQSGSS